MKCPHCLIDIHPLVKEYKIDRDIVGDWRIVTSKCSSCNNFFIELVSTLTNGAFRSKNLVYPRGSGRPPCPKEVSDNFAEDYNEACLVIHDSPKASAALSRRCLQSLLRECGGVKESNLVDEIGEFCSKPGIPSYISESLDAVRNIGNFAAHPIKSKQSGEIMPVEPGEAEWNLEVLESLFDFFFVQPARLKEKKDKLNEKLKEAGKSEMK
jgi:Domain of unknown function (DUF4145)